MPIQWTSKKLDLSFMLLLEGTVTEYPIVHSQVIRQLLLMQYLLFCA